MVQILLASYGNFRGLLVFGVFMRVVKLMGNVVYLSSAGYALYCHFYAILLPLASCRGCCYGCYVGCYSFINHPETD